MKITAIDTIELRIPYTTGGTSQTSAWGGKEWTTADALFVRVETDAGITGWGEAFGYNIIPATRIVIDDLAAPICIGADIDSSIGSIATLMQDLERKLHLFGRGGPVTYALSGIDIALWDIVGKVSGKPVWQMLGGRKPAPLNAYASLIRYGDPQVVAANVARVRSLGYRSIKLHEITVDAVAAAREAAGPDIDITLDVNCPWTREEALHMAEQLRPFNLTWLEEPVWPPEDHASLAFVRKQGGIPVSSGEHSATLMQYRHMLEAGAVDVVQPSPAKMGGISVMRDVFSLAKEFDARVVPHSFYEGPGLLAALHTSAALAPDPLIEWRFFDCEARPYGDDIVPSGGKITIPDGPGLGRDPDTRVLEKYRAA